VELAGSEEEGNVFQTALLANCAASSSFTIRKRRLEFFYKKR